MCLDLRPWAEILFQPQGLELGACLAWAQRLGSLVYVFAQLDYSVLLTSSKTNFDLCENT